MPDNLDTPIELPTQYRFGFDKTGTAIISSLAIYGAVSLSDDVVRHAKRFRTNWKARQALKAQQNPTTK